MSHTRRVLIRTGLGLATMATGAILFWPNPVPPFDPEKALAFAGALSVWLLAEFFPESQIENPAASGLDAHDVELAKTFRVLASDDFVRFLDEHDFGGSFHERDIKPLHELAHFLGNASSAFNDPDLQAGLEAVSKQANAFSYMIAFGAAPKNARASLFTMIPDNEYDGMWSEATTTRIKEANDKADELSAAIKSVLAIMRRKGFALIGQ